MSSKDDIISKRLTPGTGPIGIRGIRPVHAKQHVCTKTLTKMGRVRYVCPPSGGKQAVRSLENLPVKPEDVPEKLKEISDLAPEQKFTPKQQREEPKKIEEALFRKPKTLHLKETKEAGPDENPDTMHYIDHKEAGPDKVQDNLHFKEPKEATRKTPDTKMFVDPKEAKKKKKKGEEEEEVEKSLFLDSSVYFKKSFRSLKDVRNRLSKAVPGASIGAQKKPVEWGPEHDIGPYRGIKDPFDVKSKYVRGGVSGGGEGGEEAPATYAVVIPGGADSKLGDPLKGENVPLPGGQGRVSLITEEKLIRMIQSGKLDSNAQIMAPNNFRYTKGEGKLGTWEDLMPSVKESFVGNPKQIAAAARMIKRALDVSKIAPKARAIKPFAARESVKNIRVRGTGRVRGAGRARSTGRGRASMEKDKIYSKPIELSGTLADRAHNLSVLNRATQAQKSGKAIKLNSTAARWTMQPVRDTAALTAMRAMPKTEAKPKVKVESQVSVKPQVKVEPQAQVKPQIKEKTIVRPKTKPKILPSSSEEETVKRKKPEPPHRKLRGKVPSGKGGKKKTAQEVLRRAAKKHEETVLAAGKKGSYQQMGGEKDFDRFAKELKERSESLNKSAAFVAPYARQVLNKKMSLIDALAKVPWWMQDELLEYLRNKKKR